jgi:hypothetical protein
MFVSFFNDKISDPLGSNKINTYYEEPINNVLQDKKNGLIIFDWIWYSGWIIILVGAYIFWAWEFLDIE